jgi:hypothetical protein
VNSYQVEPGNQIQNLTIIGKISLAFVGRFWDNIFKRFYSQWESWRFKKICTDSHYKKSIAQAAGKVKSFPITYGCEFPGSKKGR